MGKFLINIHLLIIFIYDKKNYKYNNHHQYYSIMIINNKYNNQ
jgi:hypothetical protein